MKPLMPAMTLALLVGAGGVFAAEPTRIPIVHSTDLFHPHGDPDDHFDLACLFALKEFDIKGIVLDNHRSGKNQTTHSGHPAVEQMIHITGRKAPYAVGLISTLRDREDKALEEPEPLQAGVELLLSSLRESKEPVILNLVGGMTDTAVAFNREPELFRKKVRAVYIHAGNGPRGRQDEYNVKLDPVAYERVFELGVPVYWCPCYGEDGYATYFKLVDQSVAISACAPRVQNYFVYCFARSKDDPIAFLTSGPPSLPKGGRGMWCTGPMFDAAGRKIYQRGSDDFVALSPADAEKAGISDKEVHAFEFVPMRVRFAATGAPSVGEPTQTLSGQLRAIWAGRAADRVGTASLDPDGRADCCVRIAGARSDKPIKNIIVTGPKQGHWEHADAGRWWRVAFERQGPQIECFFSFYASGEHRVEIVYDNGDTQTASFAVPSLASRDLLVELRPAEPNGFVFHVTDPRYEKILASCLKNLLAELDR